MNKFTIAVIALILGVGVTLLVERDDPNSPVAIAPDASSQASEVVGISDDNPYERIPVIDGYYEGEKVWFIHTDVSDEGMAKRLTNMVGYNTVYVPKLTDVDIAKLGKVYVFTNGIEQAGEKPWEGGPFGYQIDILDSIPGDPAYTSLRNPNLVTWNDTATPRLLTSMSELQEAEQSGELVIKATNIVVNVPMVKWPSDYLSGESKM